MTAAPAVSVVMGVLNGGELVAPSIESILSQREVDLELVAVDDGSTDQTAAVLQGFAGRDPRVRVVRQDHRGLTEALVRGCSEARGRFIARQDAGDTSLPLRLALQVAHLEANPSVRLSSCWTRYVGPEGEELFVLRYAEDPVAATRLLRAPDVASHRGIGHHGSAVFRRSDYLEAGGYRPEFAFAQDVDLWLRLTDRGPVAFLQEVLYEARCLPTSLSSRFKPDQWRLGTLALEMRKLREKGADEGPLLAEAARIRPRGGASQGTPGAEGYYFIGTCLLARRDARATRYLRAALRLRPWDLKAWAALGRSVLLCR